MRIGLISDTHGVLRPAVHDVFAGVDLILHAGDIGPTWVLLELKLIAPVHAVLGNTDDWSLHPRVRHVVELELEGLPLVLVHGHQVGSPTAERLHAAWPDARIIVYGHSHRQRIDRLDDVLVVNPGAAGAARFQLKPAVALMELEQGSEPVVEIVDLT